MAASKLVDVEKQLSDLALLRDQLRAMLRDWDDRLAQTPAGMQARLLETLGAE